jgi:hypothetical protein
MNPKQSLRSLVGGRIWWRCWWRDLSEGFVTNRDLVEGKGEGNRIGGGGIEWWTEIVEALVEALVEGFGGGVGGEICWRDLLEGFVGGNRWTRWWRDLFGGGICWRDSVEGNDAGVGGGV